MRLVVQQGPDKGRVAEITEAGVTVGRDPEADLVIDDERASRRHAFVSIRDDGRVMVADMGSTNGTFVDGRRISEPIALSGGETVRVGDTEVLVVRDPESRAEPGPVRDAMVGAMLAGRYRIERRLARGGMGVVYVADRVMVGDQVAVKVLDPQYAALPAFRERFREEWKRAAAVRHPNILPVWDVGAEEDNDLFYIVMPWVEGGDLAGLLTREGPLAPARALGLLSKVAGALDHAHARGLIHRDVKPRNVLIERMDAGDESDSVYLCDFGIAKLAAVTSGLTVPGQTLGTPMYMAPEQITGDRPLDGQVDVYALGCVLFECLSMHPPFDLDSDSAVRFAHVHRPPPKLSDVRSDLGVLDAVLSRALAKEPSQRFDSCAALMMAAREAVNRGLPHDVGRPEPVPSRPPLPADGPDRVARKMGETGGQVTCPQCGTTFKAEGQEFCPNPSCGYPVQFMRDEGTEYQSVHMERRPGEQVASPPSTPATPVATPPPSPPVATPSKRPPMEPAPPRKPASPPSGPVPARLRRSIRLAAAVGSVSLVVPIVLDHADDSSRSNLLPLANVSPYGLMGGVAIAVAFALIATALVSRRSRTGWAGALLAGAGAAGAALYVSRGKWLEEGYSSLGKPLALWLPVGGGLVMALAGAAVVAWAATRPEVRAAADLGRDRRTVIWLAVIAAGAAVLLSLEAIHSEFDSDHTASFFIIPAAVLGGALLAMAGAGLRPGRAPWHLFCLPLGAMALMIQTVNVIWLARVDYHADLVLWLRAFAGLIAGAGAVAAAISATRASRRQRSGTG